MKVIFAFVTSLVGHLVAIGAFVALVSKPFFFPIGTAASLTLLLFLLIAASWAVRLSHQHPMPLFLGLLTAVGFLLVLLTLVDWAAGNSPGQPETLSNLRLYLSQIHFTPTVLTFYLGPVLLALGASAAGYLIGVRWRSRRATQ